MITKNKTIVAVLLLSFLGTSISAMNKNKKTDSISFNEKRESLKAYNSKMKKNGSEMKIEPDAIKESAVTELFMPTGFFKDYYNTNGWYKQATKTDYESYMCWKFENPINIENDSKVFHINMVQNFPYLTSLFEKTYKKKIYENIKLSKKIIYDEVKTQSCLSHFNQIFKYFCKELSKSKKMNEKVKKHIGYKVIKKKSLGKKN